MDRWSRLIPGIGPGLKIVIGVCKNVCVCVLKKTDIKEGNTKKNSEFRKCVSELFHLG